MIETILFWTFAIIFSAAVLFIIVGGISSAIYLKKINKQIETDPEMKFCIKHDPTGSWKKPWCVYERIITNPTALYKEVCIASFNLEEEAKEYYERVIKMRKYIIENDK